MLLISSSSSGYSENEGGGDAKRGYGIRHRLAFIGFYCLSWTAADDHEVLITPTSGRQLHWIGGMWDHTQLLLLLNGTH